MNQLRALLKEMDYSAATAYGWGNIDLAHGFHETKQGVRFTLGEPARRIILDRLLELNHQRHAEEVQTRPRLSQRKQNRKRQQLCLFSNDPFCLVKRPAVFHLWSSSFM